MMAPIRRNRINGEVISCFSPENDSSKLQNTNEVACLPSQPDFASSQSMTIQQPRQEDFVMDQNLQYGSIAQAGFPLPDSLPSQNQIGRPPMMTHVNPGLGSISAWDFRPQESFRHPLHGADFNPYFPSGEMVVPRWMHPMPARWDQQGSMPAPSRFNIQNRIPQNQELNVENDSDDHQDESDPVEVELKPQKKKKAPKGVGEYRGTYRKSSITFAEAWEDMVDRLKEYKEKHGDCMVPWNFKGDPKLGSWVSKQRHYKSNGSLSHDRIKILEDLGFIWDATKYAWDDMFERLTEYKKEHGDCLVPTHYKKDAKLGRWVYVQRHKRDKKMTREQAKRLERIGFKWSVHKAFWEEDDSSEGEK